MLRTYRQEANRKILELVSRAVEDFPDLRFHQILQIIGAERPAMDQWYEESDETLGNIQKGLMS